MAIDPHRVARVRDRHGVDRRRGERHRRTAAVRLDVEAWCTELDDAQFEIASGTRTRSRRGRRSTRVPRRVAARRANDLHRPAVRRPVATASREHQLRDANGGTPIRPSSADRLSTLAHRCMAGMLAHHEGTAAICAPTVNAYKRLLPDMMNGYWANWGHDDRTVAIRIAPDRGPATRLENRVPDGASNPYLAAAALLHACRLGVEGEMDAPDPQPVGADPVASVHVPASLSDALEALEGEAIVDALAPSS
jgi:glutamine synthetase